MEFIEVSAKTIDEAIAKGRAELERSNRQIVSTETLCEPTSGFLGFGRKEALVRLYFEDVVTTAEADTTATPVADVAPVATTETAPVEETAPVQETADNEDTAVPFTEEVELTREQQERIADNGKKFLQEMLSKMGLTVMIEKMISHEKITFQIHGEDLGILIGKHGQTLDAIQYLTNLVANKEMSPRCHIMVDVENYRSRREETLVRLARRIADKVKRSRSKITLEPMNAYERKIIHLTLQDEANIETSSEGQEPYRHVVVSYKRK